MKSEKRKAIKEKERSGQSKGFTPRVMNFIICSLLIITCSLMLVTCENPFSNKSSGPSAGTVPEGMGYFSLKIDVPETVKSILPGSTQNFPAYTLTFYDNATHTFYEAVDRTNLDVSAPVPLNAGLWDLEVNAYVDSGRTKLAAQGKLIGINIGLGGVTSGNVTLSGIIDITEEGTFSWNIDYPAGLAAVNIKVESRSAGLTFDQTYDIVGGTPSVGKTDSLPLYSGYYDVTFTLEKDADTQPLQWREVLHVYQNLESHFAKVFDNDLFNTILYIVKFVYNDGSTGYGTSTGTHDHTITDPGALGTMPGYVFDGWFTDNGTFSNKWNFSTMKLTGDLTLYAGWTVKVDAATPNISIHPVEPTLPYEQNTTAATLSVTVSTPTDGGTLSYQWYHNTTDTNSIISATAVGTNSNSYTPSTASIGILFYFCVVTNTNTSVNGDTSKAAASNTAKVEVTAPAFVAVTDITGVPTLAANSTPLTLSGTVEPSTATNKTIVWTVQNAGTTGATISGNTLSTTATGTVVVTATISNGLTASTDYTQDFSIIVQNQYSAWVNGTGYQTLYHALTSIGNTAGTYTVEVEDHITAPYTFPGLSTRTITLKPKSSTAEVGLFGTGNLVRVASGVTLTLEGNLTLLGVNDNTDALIRVNSNGTLNMNTGVKITGNTTTTSSSAGGVYVQGTFNMYDGEISGNPGGGVYVFSGSFTMYDGKISGNVGSGVHFNSSGKSFIMHNGEISGNNTSGTGGGVNMGSGTFTMDGGKISGNTSDGNGGGVNAAGTFTMADGEISGNTSGGNGGGVYVVSGSFTMDDGEISENIARLGGGVSLTSTTFDMHGGKILKNTATSNGGTINSGGGGVYMSMSASFNMHDGEISENTTVGTGGGVDIFSGVFSMYGGEISKNVSKIDSTDRGGGGVFLFNGQFYMYDGKIFSNEAARGGGLCIISPATVTFKKQPDLGLTTSGTITGWEDDTVEGNVTKDFSTDTIFSTGRGHAVYVISSSYSYPRRNKTVGPYQDLIWDYNATPPMDGVWTD